MTALIQEILSLGWMFNNCYQSTDGSWRVNLRRPDGTGDWFTDWAEEPTLEEALAVCMDKLHQAEFIEEQEQTSSIDQSPTPTLLTQLGLSRASKLVRRI